MMYNVYHEFIVEWNASLHDPLMISVWADIQITYSLSFKYHEVYVLMVLWRQHVPFGY